MKFGIKEAKVAGLFAKTREQKETVLAVVSMLNIENVLTKEVNKKAKKLKAKIITDNTKVSKLKDKITKVEKVVSKNSEDVAIIAATSVDWAV